MIQTFCRSDAQEVQKAKYKMSKIKEIYTLTSKCPGSQQLRNTQRGKICHGGQYLIKVLLAFGTRSGTTLSSIWSSSGASVTLEVEIILIPFYLFNFFLSCINSQIVRDCCQLSGEAVWASVSISHSTTLKKGREDQDKEWSM